METETFETMFPTVIGGTGSKVAKLAAIAANAIRNGDLHRALEVLDEIGKLARITARPPLEDRPPGR